LKQWVFAPIGKGSPSVVGSIENSVTDKRKEKAKKHRKKKKVRAGSD
jgi:hypothetical protein